MDLTPTIIRVLRSRMLRMFFAVALPGAGVLHAAPVLSPDRVQSLDSAAPGREWRVTLEKVNPAAEAEQFFAGNSAPSAAYRVVRTPSNLTTEAARLPRGGSVWYRTEFVLNATPTAPMALRLGEISDRDRAYLNGVLIGATGRWDDPRPQAYDHQRIYEAPAGLLRKGPNILHIEVQPYFSRELGLYRDRTALGPTRDILRQYYLDNVGQTLTLVAYLTLGFYFLLFFLRRRHDRENLFFGLFLFSLTVYSFLRTQFKYELGFELYELKRIQTLAVFISVPLFYLFIRNYYELPPRLARWWDRIAYVVHAVPIGAGAVVAFAESTELWQNILDRVVQPVWIIYVIAVLVILVRAALQRNRDAYVMLASCVLLVVALVLDILTGQARINLPTILTYAFTLFVVGMALILANRFVRLHDETEDLNTQLERFNAASRRFVPFEFLQLLEKGSIVDVELGDQVQREMTVLFSDIRSFTTLSESMTPRENFDFINSYLARMGPVIRAHNGFIDKYIGDAIMALFADSADDALRASVEMQLALQKWNASRAKYALAPVRVGVGLHRGLLMLGTIGENQRMEGTVIADAVNLASRIEGLTKQYGAAILLSDETRRALKDPDQFQMRFIDRVRVKGKSEPVTLYEALSGLPEETRRARLASLDQFQAAADRYASAEFRDAERLFLEIYNQSADPAAALYVRRCREFLKNGGAPEGWDGATILKNK